MKATDLTKRHSRRLKKDRDTREALKLERRLSELHSEQRDSAVTVELPKPVRDGWVRYFVVRPDFRKSEDGPYLERVLRLIQRRETSRRKDFAARDWQRGGKIAPTPHELGSITPEAYWVLTERMRSHFRLNARREKTWRGERLVTEFVAACPWKFESRVRTNWRTHETVSTFDGDGERSEIFACLYGPRDWLIRHSLRHRGANRMGRNINRRKLPPDYDAININQISSSLTIEAE